MDRVAQILDNVVPMSMTHEDEVAFLQENKCYFCKKPILWRLTVVGTAIVFAIGGTQNHLEWYVIFW